MFIDDLFGHDVLPSLDKRSKGRDDIGRDGDGEHVEEKKYGILDNSENAFVFEFIEDSGGSSLLEPVEEIGEVDADCVPGVERVEVL
jgi:hypothetical protein